MSEAITIEVVKTNSDRELHALIGGGAVATALNAEAVHIEKDLDSIAPYLAG